MAIYSCIYPSGYTLNSEEQTLYGLKCYTSMSAWEAVENTNLSDILYCNILPGDVNNNWGTAGKDTNNVTFSGWICTVNSKYILISTVDNPSPLWDESKYVFSGTATSTRSFYINNSGLLDIRFVGIQIEQAQGYNANLIYLYNSANMSFIRFFSCRIRQNNAYSGIYHANSYIWLGLYSCIFEGNGIGTYGYINNGEKIYSHVVNCLFTGWTTYAVYYNSYSKNYNLNNVYFNNTNDTYRGIYENCAADKSIDCPFIVILGNSSVWNKTFKDYINGDYRLKNEFVPLFDAGTFSCQNMIDCSNTSIDYLRNTIPKRLNPCIGPFEHQTNISWLPGWRKRIRLSISSDKIDSDLTWFPVTVFLNENNIGEEFFQELTHNSLYNKIAFTTGDGISVLNAECELFDSVNKQAIYHISHKNWTLKGNQPNYIYCYYDYKKTSNGLRTGIITSYSASLVWDDNYIGVFHGCMSQQASQFRFNVLGEGDYGQDGELYIFDDKGNWWNWKYSYTTYWQEIVVDLRNPYSKNGELDWANIDYYRFDLNTSGRTVYIDNIRVFNFNGNYIHTNSCESTNSWYASNGTIARNSSNKYEGNYSIKFTSTANDGIALYNPSGNFKWGGILNSKETDNLLAVGFNNGSLNIKPGLQFDGDDYIKFSDVEVFQETGSQTLETVAKVSSAGIDTIQCMFMKGDDYGGSWGFRSYIQDPGMLLASAIVTMNPSIVQYSVTDNSPKDFNVKFHHASVFDNSAQKLKLYSDGIYINEVATGNTIRHNGSSHIGCFFTGAGDFRAGFNGIIYEVRLSKIVRSSTWVKVSSLSLLDQLLEYGNEETQNNLFVKTL